MTDSQEPRGWSEPSLLEVLPKLSWTARNLRSGNSSGHTSRLMPECISLLLLVQGHLTWTEQGVEPGSDDTASLLLADTGTEEQTARGQGDKDKVEARNGYRMRYGWAFEQHNTALNGSQAGYFWGLTGAEDWRLWAV